MHENTHLLTNRPFLVRCAVSRKRCHFVTSSVNLVLCYVVCLNSMMHRPCVGHNHRFILTFFYNYVTSAFHSCSPFHSSLLPPDISITTNSCVARMKYSCSVLASGFEVIFQCSKIPKQFKLCFRTCCIIRFF